MKISSRMNCALFATLAGLLVGCTTSVDMIPGENISPSSSIMVQGEGCKSEQMVSSLEGQLAITGYSVISSSKSTTQLEIFDEVEATATVGGSGDDSGTTEAAAQGDRRFTSGVVTRLPSDYVVQFNTTCNGYGEILSLYGTIRQQVSGRVVGSIEHNGPISPSKLAKSIVSNIPLQ